MRETKLLLILLTVSLAACSASTPLQRDAGADDTRADPVDAVEGEETDMRCPAGTAACAGACVDTGSSHDNCGACGRACPPLDVCSGGECVGECPPGQTDCGGSCVDLSSDVRNCRSCGVECLAGLHAVPRCDDTFCTYECEAGWSDLNGDGSCEVNCVPSSSAELCNGIDDDCDGATDEGFDCGMGREVPCAAPCGTTGSGTCGLDCTPPAPSACAPPGEICNGEDDDCDGACDDGFGCCRGAGAACATGCGSAGAKTCTEGCEWGVCVPPAESCNGSDDDCDGNCDNGFACCRGTISTCTTTCGSSGTKGCSASCSWEACVPPVESCNGEDDDCDGACDDGFACCRGASDACTTTCRSSGTKRCGASCSWESCVPPAESCNGADDDCDGACDDGFSCCRGARSPCTTSCGSTGTAACGDSCSWGDCAPPAESCDGSDDDCDGLPDDLAGCRVPVYRFVCGTDHFYSLSPSTPSGCSPEGIAWYDYAAKVTGRSFSTTTLFVLYLAAAPDHFYCTSEAERDYAVSLGYVLQGNIGYCSPSAVAGMTTPLYRLYSTTSGDHFYTVDATEKDEAISLHGYTYEGVECHAWGTP